MFRLIGIILVHFLGLPCMKRMLLVLIGCLASGWLQSAAAVRVKSLYQVNLPVMSQQADVRQQAFSEAFRQVLVRVSGNLSIAEQPVIRMHLSDAASFVDEYYYEKKMTPPNFPWSLSIQFDSNHVNQLLQQVHATVWGENRPLILCWLVDDLSADAHVTTLDDADGIVTILKQQAKRRGLPMIFPVMDLSEVRQVPVTDVSSANFTVLLPASKRYGSDFIVAGRLFHTIEGYHVATTVHFPDEQFVWDIVDPTVSGVLSHFVDRLANLLATRYASVVTEQVQSELQMTIVGIRENADMDKILQYLNSLPLVANSRIVQVNGSSVVLDLSLRGTLSAFNEAISVDQHLERVDNEKQSIDKSVWQWKE